MVEDLGWPFASWLTASQSLRALGLRCRVSKLSMMHDTLLLRMLHSLCYITNFFTSDHLLYASSACCCEPSPKLAPNPIFNYKPLEARYQPAAASVDYGVSAWLSCRV